MSLFEFICLIGRRWRRISQSKACGQSKVTIDKANIQIHQLPVMVLPYCSLLALKGLQECGRRSCRLGQHSWLRTESRMIHTVWSRSIVKCLKKPVRRVHTKWINGSEIDSLEGLYLIEPPNPLLLWVRISLALSDLQAVRTCKLPTR